MKRRQKTGAVASATTQFQYVPPYGQFLFRWMISVQSSVRRRRSNKLIKIESVKVCMAWTIERHKDYGDCIVSRTIWERQREHEQRHCIWCGDQYLKSTGKSNTWLLIDSSKWIKFETGTILWVMPVIKMTDKQSQPLIPKWQ